ncbi:PqqD family peptide modification chaperone [Streptomyces sp. NPDC001941]|uniref:PqqD family peptide modification chaperone n=1 Tax=Streptomyces sp. NPDC001941 TaxID=3154659 RepID=UPI003322E44D
MTRNRTVADATDPAPAPAPVVSWMDTETPAARPDIEIVEGIDHQLVAFDPVSGHYTRLSRSGAAILRALDGTHTGRQFAAAAVRSGGHGKDAEGIVLAFLEELRAAGLLTVPPEPGARSDAVRFARRSHMPRRALARESLDTVIRPIAALVGRAPRVVAALWCLAALATLWQIGRAFTAPDAVARFSPAGLTWGWALLLLFLVQTPVHELSHAVACRHYGVRIREMGVGLLFYVVPAAYVDRTDAYRLSARRPRVVIALAGVAVDLLWAGGYALLATRADGQLAQAASLVLLLQVVLLIGNLNPLLPTDGYQALEAGLGVVNLRARAFTALRCTVRRGPRPSWLTARTRAQRAGYQVFGLVCLGYAAMVAVMLVHTVGLAVG